MMTICMSDLRKKIIFAKKKSHPPLGTIRDLRKIVLVLCARGLILKGFWGHP